MNLDVRAVAGGMIILVGGCLALWPRAMADVSQDADGNPIPPTPANLRWLRRVGFAFVLFGAVLIWMWLAGVKGDPDPVLI